MMGLAAAGNDENGGANGDDYNTPETEGSKYGKALEGGYQHTGTDDGEKDAQPLYFGGTAHTSSFCNGYFFRLSVAAAQVPSHPEDARRTEKDKYNNKDDAYLEGTDSKILYQDILHYFASRI